MILNGEMHECEANAASMLPTSAGSSVCSLSEMMFSASRMAAVVVAL